MRKTKSKPPPKNEDPAQSQRFLDLARELEAAGELSPTEDGKALEDLFCRAVRGDKSNQESD